MYSSLCLPPFLSVSLLFLISFTLEAWVVLKKRWGRHQRRRWAYWNSVFFQCFLTPSCVLGPCEVHCVSVLLWCGERVHMHACDVCVCPCTCPHRCAVKVLPFPSSAWCLYFILYAVTSMAKRAFLCIFFQFLLSGHWFATQRHQWGSCCPPLSGPLLFQQGTLFAPEAEMQLRRPQHLTRFLGSAVVSSNFPVLCSNFNCPLELFCICFHLEFELLLKEFSPCYFWIVFKKAREYYALSYFPRILSKGLKGSCNGSEGEKDWMLKILFLVEN